ncbi:WUSCHEL-related homeobox [Musa troglodytarum]|uniref:WUSCHEL-related homeobox n=2 Tax=Musa troglodytarum TaxID=320322 RepID=A0A9E7FT26_9LILI|nr:WUSCHEL-related homeobox [Musa troglodytarum]
MDDRNQDSYGGPNLQRSTLEPLRTRWTPKPEQILILESIFNSGMVNPPKDETVRIRKLLEQFGSVGDANVFYWFQNRRSRSRRRQRQLQASLMADPRAAGAAQHAGAAATSSSSNSPGGGFFACASSPSAAASSSSSDFVIDDSADDLFSISRQMGFVEATQTPPFTCSSGVSHLHIQPGQSVHGFGVSDTIWPFP